MKIKGIKWWVAFCEVMMFAVFLPIMIICYVGLFPSLLVINKRDTGEFGVKQIFTAIGIVMTDLKDALIDAIEEMDEMYEK